MPVKSVIISSSDLEIEIKVKHFRQNMKNIELGKLIMDFAIEQIIK